MKYGLINKEGYYWIGIWYIMGQIKKIWKAGWDANTHSTYVFLLYTTVIIILMCYYFLMRKFINSQTLMYHILQKTMTEEQENIGKFIDENYYSSKIN